MITQILVSLVLLSVVCAGVAFLWSGPSLLSCRMPGSHFNVSRSFCSSCGPPDPVFCSTWRTMPIGFLYNRRPEGCDIDGFLQKALAWQGYRKTGACVPLTLFLKDVPRESASTVGIVACSVEAVDMQPRGNLPVKVNDRDVQSVLDVAQRACLPKVVETQDVVRVQWADSAQDVFECLMRCASMHAKKGSQTRKKHGGEAQHILSRELQALRADPPGFCTRPPLQPVAAFLCEEGELREWPEADTWMTKSSAEPRCNAKKASGKSCA